MMIDLWIDMIDMFMDMPIDLVICMVTDWLTSMILEVIEQLLMTVKIRLMSTNIMGNQSLSASHLSSLVDQGDHSWIY